MTKKESDSNKDVIPISKSDSSDKLSNDLSDSGTEKIKKKTTKKRKVSSETDEEIIKVEGERNVPVGKPRKARNSIVLYHEHSKNKKKGKSEDEQKNEEEGKNTINNINNIVNNSKFSSELNSNNKSPKVGGAKKKAKKEKKVVKKVNFLEPNFVSIIDVESYKQYNLENTSKDPYFDDVQEGKDSVKCTCIVI